MSDKHHDGHHHHDPHQANHRPHDEQVVLEIGGDLGALIVYTDPTLLHTEIEISPAEEDERRSHKDVLERIVADRSLYARRLRQTPARLLHTLA